MIEILLALALPTPYPNVWANDYCVYRGVVKMGHEEAVAAATAATGEPTDEAWDHVSNNTTWCPDDE